MMEQLGASNKATQGKVSTGSKMGPNLYEILEVSPQASRLQIREAYIRLKHTYASGSQALYSLVSEDEARQTLEKMEEAYRVLDDELQRKVYDEGLGLQRETKTVSGHPDPFGGVPASESPSPRSTNPVGGEKTSFQNDGPMWAAEPSEVRPVSRRVSTFTKIKKFAARAFEGEVKAQEATLLARPQTFDGAILTQLREMRGVPQSEVQERTKIAIEYIKALENNDFQKLPSLVYVRGFLKIYLQYLGLQDEEARPLLEAYSERYNHWREKHRPHSS